MWGLLRVSMNRPEVMMKKSDFTENLCVSVSRSKVNLQTYDSRAREWR